MAITIEELKTIEKDWYNALAEYGLNDNEIAVNLGYRLAEM